MSLNVFKYSLVTLFAISLLFSSKALIAQEYISIEDYQRAVGFMHENYHNKKVFNLNIRPNWFPDSTGVWYIDHSHEAKKYLKISLPDLERSDLFDHQRLSQILSDSLETDIDAKNLPIQSIKYKSPTELEINVKSKSYILNTNNYSLKNMPLIEEV